MYGKELSSFAVMEADTKMLVNKNKKLWTLRKYFERTDILFTDLNLPIPIVKIKGNSNFSSFWNILYRINVKMYGSIFNFMPHLLVKRTILYFYRLFFTFRSISPYHFENHSK